LISKDATIIYDEIEKLVFAALPYQPTAGTKIELPELSEVHIPDLDG
jgi:hypothetical protein